jgi:hypothetical protein
MYNPDRASENAQKARRKVVLNRARCFKGTIRYIACVLVCPFPAE